MSEPAPGARMLSAPPAMPPKILANLPGCFGASGGRAEGPVVTGCSTGVLVRLIIASPSTGISHLPVYSIKAPAAAAGHLIARLNRPTPGEIPSFNRVIGDSGKKFPARGDFFRLTRGGSGRS